MSVTAYQSLCYCQRYSAADTAYVGETVQHSQQKLESDCNLPAAVYSDLALTGKQAGRQTGYISRSHTGSVCKTLHTTAEVHCTVKYTVLQWRPAAHRPQFLLPACLTAQSAASYLRLDTWHKCCRPGILCLLYAEHRLSSVS